MREIKFRAWNELPDGGEMVTEENSGLTSAQILDRFSIVMQYTGIKDRNGVEIYEGDVCETSYGENFVVVFNKNGFTGCMDGSFLFNNILPTSAVVIGNMHENPELVK